LLRDNHRLADRLGSSDQGSFSADESRSAVYLPNTKSFPDNTEFEAMITLAGKASGEISSVTPDANSVTVRMHQSFIKLPDDKFKPRKFDTRSGYYRHMDYMDFATPIGDPIVNNAEPPSPGKERPIRSHE
jgi:hypothetical protein